MMMTLLGALARFGSFSTQSELLCTQGLAHVLQTYDFAASALAEKAAECTSDEIGVPLTWHAEVIHDDKSRPDLEARSGDVPFIMIEAKLGAKLSAAQLRAYAKLLQRYDDGEAALLVLVPDKRVGEATIVATKAFGPPRSGQWYLTDSRRPCGVAVISWNELLKTLRGNNDDRYEYDLEQLRQMYRQLRGDYIAPLADIEDLMHWRERETDFINVVKEATRQLTTGGRLLPFQLESLEEPTEEPEGHSDELEDQGYRRRYVRSPSDDSDSYFSIGVRDPFAGWTTPIWMRFHKGTDKFEYIRQRIKKDPAMKKRDPSTKKKGWLESGGHIWIPMTVPLEVSGEQMIERIIEQAKKVLRVAYQIE